MSDIIAAGWARVTQTAHYDPPKKTCCACVRETDEKAILCLFCMRYGQRLVDYYERIPNVQ